MRSITIIAALILISSTALADVLVTTTVNGKISVIPHLSHKDCEKSRRYLLRQDQIEAMEKASDVECPIDTSESGWKKWQKDHCSASGCRSKNGGMAWDGIIINGDDVDKAECLK